MLVLTISNRIVRRQNSWSVNPHIDTHVHFVCLRVQTNISCYDDTGDGWEDRNEDKDTMITETPLKGKQSARRKQKSWSFLYACCTPLRPFLQPTLEKHPCPHTTLGLVFPFVFNLSKKRLLTRSGRMSGSAKAEQRPGRGGWRVEGAVCHTCCPRVALTLQISLMS